MTLPFYRLRCRGVRSTTKEPQVMPMCLTCMRHTDQHYAMQITFMMPPGLTDGTCQARIEIEPTATTNKTN